MEDPPLEPLAAAAAATFMVNPPPVLAAPPRPGPLAKAVAKWFPNDPSAAELIRRLEETEDDPRDSSRPLLGVEWPDSGLADAITAAAAAADWRLANKMLAFGWTAEDMPAAKDASGLDEETDPDRPSDNEPLPGMEAAAEDESWLKADWPRDMFNNELPYLDGQLNPKALPLANWSKPEVRPKLLLRWWWRWWGWWWLWWWLLLPLFVLVATFDTPGQRRPMDEKFWLTNPLDIAPTPMGPTADEIPLLPQLSIVLPDELDWGEMALSSRSKLDCNSSSRLRPKLAGEWEN